MSESNPLLAAGLVRDADDREPKARLVSLDASTWDGLRDFYEATLAAIEAPSWHGRNFNALWEALVQGGTDCLPPPIEIVVHNVGTLAPADHEELTALSERVLSGCDDLLMDPGSRIHLLPNGAS